MVTEKETRVDLGETVMPCEGKGRFRCEEGGEEKNRLRVRRKGEGTLDSSLTPLKREKERSIAHEGEKKKEESEENGRQVPPSLKHDDRLVRGTAHQRERKQYHPYEKGEKKTFVRGGGRRRSGFLLVRGVGKGERMSY